MLAEMSNDQRRQLIDAQQAFHAWREADREFRHSYRGGMRWRRIGGHDYLYRIQGKVEKSLGPRSSRTEQLLAEYQSQRTRLRERRRRLSGRLD